jgi:hypothetical protein
MIQVSGVLWTDREHSVLIESPAADLCLNRAIAVSSVPAEMKENAPSERLKSDCLRFIHQEKVKDPNSRWVVFQAPVVLEGWFADAASLPSKVGSEAASLRRADPFGGCSWRLQVVRVIEYDQKNAVANPGGSEHAQRSAP